MSLDMRLSVIFLHLSILLLSYLTDLVSTYSDGYIGCYTQSIYMKSTYIRGNNGRVCKKHCFPDYRYAGTELNDCYCGFTLSDSKINDSKCSFRCPGQPYIRTCGGVSSMTIYDINEIAPTPEAEPSIESQINHNVNKNNVEDSFPLESDGLSTNDPSIVKEESGLCIVVSSSVAFGLLVLLIMVLVVYRCTSKIRPNRGQPGRDGGYLTPTNNARDAQYAMLRSNQNAINMNVVMNSRTPERTYI